MSAKTNASTTTDADREKVRDTLLMRFNRRGGATRVTADFRSFPADQQQQILAAAQLAPQELPVLMSQRDDHSWTLITTQRVVWKNGLAVDSLKGSQIEATVSPSTPVNDPKRILLSPAGLPLAIRIESVSSVIIDLPVEPDKQAYAALHYVLTFILEAAQLKKAPAGAAPAAKPAAKPAKKSWFK
jgi:hypothetical protein